MKKIYLLFVMLTLALGVFAQSKGKNAMTLRLVDIKVTDGTLVNIAKEQEAKGNTKPMDMIRIYEGNVRAKLDEVAKASGRFEISDENALEALTRDAEASLFMKMSRAEKIEYVSSKQNDYTLSCDINSCQFTRRAGTGKNNAKNSPAGQPRSASMRWIIWKGYLFRSYSRQEDSMTDRE